MASSRIEGTQASLSDVYQAPAQGGGAPGSDVKEVENDVAAMDEGAAAANRTAPTTPHSCLPSPKRWRKAIADWERFVNGDHQLPPLVACGLLHYQFETIHPFLDGNGRLGRLLLVFLLQQERLPDPLLYVSPYFEQRRSEYYERLQAVRERDEIQEWLCFFLRAVAVQAGDAADRAERLVDIRERYRRDLAGSRSRVRDVVDPCSLSRW